MIQKTLEQIIINKRASFDEPLNGDDIEELLRDIREKIEEHEGDKTVKEEEECKHSMNPGGYCVYCGEGRDHS